ncbi:hypothetical protein [Methanimicrococcus stummii]|uniref:hypothetical protein n=1 Tax=Methanimicrococcus stummii TaxID=3028294 RepID=UPI0029311F3E|nr:hypothetical protein [Methanimicrococcus sp. Es2]
MQTLMQKFVSTAENRFNQLKPNRLQMKIIRMRKTKTQETIIVRTTKANTRVHKTNTRVHKTNTKARKTNTKARKIKTGTKTERMRAPNRLILKLKIRLFQSFFHSFSRVPDKFTTAT